MMNDAAEVQVLGQSANSWLQTNDRQANHGHSSRSEG